jgi:hypothetical protein
VASWLSLSSCPRRECLPDRHARTGTARWLAGSSECQAFAFQEPGPLGVDVRHHPLTLEGHEYGAPTQRLRERRAGGAVRENVTLVEITQRGQQLVVKLGSPAVEALRGAVRCGADAIAAVGCVAMPFEGHTIGPERDVPSAGGAARIHAPGC